MCKIIGILLILISSRLSAQDNIVQSVYFEFDIFLLNKTEIDAINKIIQSPDFFKIEAIQLYGYCDDRGSNNYNDKLSKKRVETVQKLLVSKGILARKIFISEGRGEVDLNKNSVLDVDDVRGKNRRVDIIFVKKTNHTSFPEHPKIGDHIILKLVTFEMGSSELSMSSKNELDRVALLLKKHKTVRFEIKGHVCCTSNKYTDAIDEANSNRNLSENRARNVFMYLRAKGISPYRMSFKGYGNRFPLGGKEVDDRRVELHINYL